MERGAREDASAMRTQQISPESVRGGLKSVRRSPEGPGISLGESGGVRRGTESVRGPQISPEESSGARNQYGRDAGNWEEMQEINTRFEELQTRVMEKPQKSHEMKALKAYLESAPKEQGALHLKILSVSQPTDFLHGLGKEISDEDMLMSTKVYMDDCAY